MTKEDHRGNQCGIQSKELVKLDRRNRKKKVRERQVWEVWAKRGERVWQDT